MRRKIFHRYIKTSKIPKNKHLIKDFKLSISRRFFRIPYAAQYDCIKRKLNIVLDYEKEKNIEGYINLETVLELSCHLSDSIAGIIACRLPKYKGTKKCPIKPLLKECINHG